MSFSNKTKNEIQYYVYALIDNYTNKIFYVGKGGHNDRAFDHLKDEKFKNRDFRVDIIRHRLESEDIAFHVEAALIDALGIENLENIQSGHDSGKIRDKEEFKGRISAYEIDKLFSKGKIEVEEFEHNIICFFPDPPRIEKFGNYDSCRQYWEVSRKRVIEKLNGSLKYEYAFLCNKNFIQEIYKILAWYPAGTTATSREKPSNPHKEYEFIGQVVSDAKIIKKYKHKNIFKDKGKPLHPPQGRGVRYFPKLKE